MKITWEADDGYAGGAAPQSLKIPDSDILDCETVDEAMEMIEQAINDDFANKVSWTCDLPKVRVEVAALLRSKSE